MHLHQYALNMFEQVDTLSVHTQHGGQNFRRSYILLQRAGFNPHLTNPFVLISYHRYQVTRTLVYHYGVITR